MTWTDSNAIGSEEYMVLSWLCSGGNMLFGQWGLPKDVGTLNGANINMEEVIPRIRIPKTRSRIWRSGVISWVGGDASIDFQTMPK